MKKLYPYFILIIIVALTLFYFLHSGKQYIFLITLDTTRADHIDYSLNDNGLTPNLAEIASKGIYYKNAFTLIPITLPSHSNMFYSLPPYKLGVYNNGDVVKVPYENITELLRKDGYSTKGVISLGVLKSEYGLSKGFNKVSEEFSNGLFYKDAIEVNKEVFKLLKRGRGEKEFYWIHYSDPHSPYFPPSYKGGKFTVTFNKNIVHTCKSTDYKKIDLELSLTPGVNYLNFRTKLPKAIRSNNNIRIYVVSFIDFKAKSVNPEDKYEVFFPEGWNRQENKNELIVGTARRRGKIVFTNREKRNINLNVSFIYRIIETIPSSKYLYCESVKFLDSQIGELIKYLKKEGLYKDSVFVIVGDHGEGLGEFKKEVGHVDYLNGLFTRIPLIISGKGITRKGENTIPVSTLGIAPTVLKLAGIKKPQYMVGEDLIKHRGKGDIFQATYSPEAYDDGFSIIDYPFQLIYYPDREEIKFEFYNIENDRNGINSLIGDKKYSKIIMGLKKKLIKFAKYQKKFKKINKDKKLTEDQKDMLKSLGYL